jgi:peptide/nickel transport system substrate-binding protein
LAKAPAMTIATIRTVLRRTAALACVAATLAGCSRVDTTATTGSEQNAFTQPHHLRVALQGDVSFINPLLTVEAQAQWIDALTMAWLVRYDRHNELVPELATTIPTQQNGGISADGKTITYHLRTNAKWSDGKPFSAADIAFTVGVVNDPKTNVQSREGFDQIIKIDTPNSFTVVFHLKAPYSPFVATIFSTGSGGGPAILPKHLLAHTANINTDPYNALPVGIGPFKFTKWARADAIELAADPLYFRGRPKLDRITFKIIPNRDTIMSELQTGDLDLWAIAAFAYLSRMQDLKGFHVIRQPGFGYGHLDFNVTHPGISDPIVRRALLMAWNRREQREKVSHGVGILQDGVYSPSSPYFDPKIGFTAFDPRKANALLDAAGWKRGPDGIRAKDGVRLNLNVVTNVGSPDTDLRIELLRQDWKTIGVSFTRKEYAPNQLFASMQENGIVQNGKFDVVFFAWYPNASGDELNTFGCAKTPPAGQNDIHWCNRRADAAMNDFVASYDLARRKRDADILQVEMQRDTPTMVSSMYEDLFAVNDDVKNFHPHNLPGPYDSFMDVDI